jgi:hypothetical protein
MQQLTAEESVLRAFIRRQTRSTAMATGLGVALSAAILIVEYRLMIFAIIAMAIPLILIINAWRSRRDLWGESFRELVVRDGTLVMRGADGDRELAFHQVTHLRVTPDHLVVVYPGDTAHQVRMWILPGRAEELAAIGERLSAAGVGVTHEPGLGRGLVAMLGGLILVKLLAVAAAALVLGALAHGALALVGSGGSWTVALALFAGAVALATGAALARALLMP